jgi:hypothetical protein
MRAQLLDPLKVHGENVLRCDARYAAGAAIITNTTAPGRRQNYISSAGRVSAVPMPEYTHTLIPDELDLNPDPRQVAAFLASLGTMGAAPLQPAISVSKLSGEVRSLTNPFTGKTEARATRKAETVGDLSELPAALRGLDDYSVTISGKGPPEVPALAFDFGRKYDFLIHCCLRDEVVSTSDWHDEVPIKRKVEFFGRPCNSGDRLGIFHNPKTLEVIEVPKAGCARFWIEFEYGKMLFPRIEDNLQLIEPLIVHAAEREFDSKFVQGCHWCA